METESSGTRLGLTKQTSTLLSFWAFWHFCCISCSSKRCCFSFLYLSFDNSSLKAKLDDFLKNNNFVIFSTNYANNSRCTAVEKTLDYVPFVPLRRAPVQTSSCPSECTLSAWVQSVTRREIFLWVTKSNAARNYVEVVEKDTVRPRGGKCCAGREGRWVKNDCLRMLTFCPWWIQIKSL